MADLLIVVARVVLLGVIVVSPWLFAGIEAETQVWLFLAVTIAALCFLLGILIPYPRTVRLPWTTILPLLAIGLGVIQLIPLDRRVAATISPGANRLYDELAAMTPSPDAALEKRFAASAGEAKRAVSLYPASSRRDLALLSLAAAVFVLGAGLFRNPTARLVLCWLLAINGAAIAFFGMVQQSAWNGRLFWQVELKQGGSPFGPFVDRNNAGGYLLLCLAAALALSVWAIQRARPATDRFADDGREGRLLRSMFQRLQQGLADLPARWNDVTFIALALAGFIAAGVLCTLSRGSILSLAGAGSLVVVIAATHRRARSYLVWIGLVAVAGIGLVFWVGMTESLQARLATLNEQQVSTDGRIPNWRDAIHAAGDYWAVGSGLGTYRFVYGLYEAHPSKVWYYHAENQYLEYLVETGLPGLMLMLFMLGLVGHAAWRLFRRSRRSIDFAFSLAAIFALAGQVLHSITDFDLYMPANLGLFALLCGTVAGGSAYPADQHQRSVAFGPSRRHWFTVAVAGITLLAVSLGYRESRRNAAIETAMAQSRFFETADGPAATLDQLDSAIDSLSQALQGQEDHASGQQRLAGLWVERYRLQALAKLRLTPELREIEDRVLWNYTSLAVLHGRALEFVRSGQWAYLDALRKEPAVAENLLPALAHVAAARRGCPLLGPVELILAQTAFLIDDPGSDRGPLERARRLAPANPQVLLGSGALDLDAGRIESAQASWRRCLELEPARLQEIVALAEPGMSIGEIIDGVLPASPTVLVEYARTVAPRHPTGDCRTRLGRRLDEVAKQDGVSLAQRHYWQGLALALGDKGAAAIDEYSAAVDLDPRQDVWHYELALLLKQSGRLSEAYQQALLCNRLAPENPTYQELLKTVYPTIP